MTAWLPRWIACLILVLPFLPVVAVDPDDAEIARLVKQLGSDKFKEREAATKRLKEIGEPALEALGKPADSLEVRVRADAIIAVIEDKLFREPRSIGTKVYTFVVSADGKRLLTGGYDKTLRLWDVDTCKELRVFEGHTEAIHAVALSPDGKRVLSASGDHSVRLWDAQTGEELRKYEGHTHQVFSVAFGPQGQAISGDFLGSMHLWDLNTGKKAGVFACHSHPDGLNATRAQLGKAGGFLVNAVAYSEKAKLAVTCGANQWIRLWNLETGKEVRKLTHADFADVCFSPDGKRLAGLYEEVLRIWDVETGNIMFGIGVKAGRVAFSPDGKRLVTGGWEDNAVRVLDAGGKELRKYEGQQRGYVSCVMFFPDGKRIASVSGNDGVVRIWRAPR